MSGAISNTSNPLSPVTFCQSKVLPGLFHGLKLDERYWGPNIASERQHYSGGAFWTESLRRCAGVYNCHWPAGAGHFTIWVCGIKGSGCEFQCLVTLLVGSRCFVFSDHVKSQDTLKTKSLRSLCLLGYQKHANKVSNVTSLFFFPLKNTYTCTNT